MDQKELAKHWWAILIRGIIAVGFAFFAFLWTGLTLEFLLILLGVYFILDATFSFVAAIVTASHHKKWWFLLIEGIITLFAGVFVLLYPVATVTILVYLVALWAIFTGLIEFWAAISAPWVSEGKIFVGLGGVISIILGILIFAYPTISLFLMILFLGVYAFVFGISLIVFSLKIKK